MATRTTFNGASQDVPWKDTGDDEGFGNQYARHIKTLYDAGCFPLTDVVGVNAITGTVEPETNEAHRDGAKFTFTAVSDNTQGMSLQVRGRVRAPIVQSNGDAVTAGMRVMVEYVGGTFYIIGGTGGAGIGLTKYYWQFTASGTLGLSDAKALLSPDTMVTVEAWGGGGGGGAGSGASGGGGGAYKRAIFRLGDLPSSLGIGVGAGGGEAQGGGNTTFGTLLTAYGGASPYSTADYGGNGGGNSGHGDARYLVAKNAESGSALYSGVNRANPVNPWEGGLGGRGGPNGAFGGSSVYGGGGGSGWNNSSNGTSIFGGNGGSGNGSVGLAPAGGGACWGSGARGEVRVWI